MVGYNFTISKYYLPSGKSISEVGVSPDIIVEEQNLFEFDTDNDNQLNYAIKLFNHKMLSKLPMRQGVGVIVLNQNNEVFVAKRKDNPIDKWQMPQGGININETFNAMKRERRRDKYYNN